MTLRTVRGACPHDCPDTCSMLVTVDDDTGRAVRVRGDPRHRTTGGFLCAKVNRYLQRTYSPDRILHPMRRVGPKGEGLFERISWDEALDLVAERLSEVAQSDPQRILPYSYSGTLGLIQNGSMDFRFFHRLGASLLDRTICSTCGSEALDEVMGSRLGPDMAEFAKAGTIVAWGTNLITSNVHIWPFVKKARANGARFVVIDPVRTRTAAQADEHLPIRPGTDAALALGLMHLIFRWNREDRAYLDAHCDGTGALEQEVRAHWPPERVAAMTGIPQPDLEAMARRLVDAPPVAIRLNYGLQRHAGGGAAVRAILALACVLGAWRHEGGGAMLSTSGAFPVDARRLGRPDLLPNPSHPPRTINMTRLGEALDPQQTRPPVDALFVYASNPAAVAPDGGAVRTGLLREDLFCVVHELFMTDTARHADVLLPATTQLEQLDIHKSYGHYDILLNSPSIEPLGEAVPNTELFRRLAARMGFDDPCFRQSDEELVRQAFRWSDPAMAGIDVDRLKREGPLRVKQPSAPFAQGAPAGRIQLALPGRPFYVPPAENPDGEREPRPDLGLVLLSPPAHHFLNSTFVNLPFAKRAERGPKVRLHPRDARARSLQSGETVEIYNDRGAFRAELEITEDVRPGVACAPSIWWPSLAGGTNANAVTSQRLTDVGRGATFYDCAVEVRSAAGSAS